MDTVVMERIAIIPARAGSKRLPRKSLMVLGERPMIAWTILAALESRIFGRVLVSTDSEEIASVARHWGAEAPFLRQRYSDDVSPVSLATIDALEQAERHWDEHYSVVAQLMPNCPLRTAHDIGEAVAAFEDSTSEFQISCFKFGWMNPWWAATVDQSGRPSRLFDEAFGRRSQDLADLYCPTGAIWLASTIALKDAMTFYGNGHRYQPLDWVSAVDIDEHQDFDLARALLDMRNDRNIEP